MQLKAMVKKIAREKKISAQLVLQNYMLERFLERVSLSEYHDKFILKGGFLIASMVGLDSRATMDMDATIKGYKVSQDTIQDMIENILTVGIEDGVFFIFNYIENIRKDDDYSGYRVHLSGVIEKMQVPIKLDITTGDAITPKEIEYDYRLMFENKHISILAYNLATVLSEKLETILSRGDQNTRPRDYYDVFILFRTFRENIDFASLKSALIATSRKRGSSSIIENYKDVIKQVRLSDVMKKHWVNYQKEFDYAAEIEFSLCCKEVLNIMDRLNMF